MRSIGTMLLVWMTVPACAAEVKDTDATHGKSTTAEIRVRADLAVRSSGLGGYYLAVVEVGVAGEDGLPMEAEVRLVDAEGTRTELVRGGLIQADGVDHAAYMAFSDGAMAYRPPYRIEVDDFELGPFEGPVESSPRAFRSADDEPELHLAWEADGGHDTKTSIVFEEDIGPRAADDLRVIVEDTGQLVVRSNGRLPFDVGYGHARSRRVCPARIVRCTDEIDLWRRRRHREDGVNLAVLVLDQDVPVTGVPRDRFCPRYDVTCPTGR